MLYAQLCNQIKSAFTYIPGQGYLVCGDCNDKTFETISTKTSEKFEINFIWSLAEDDQKKLKFHFKIRAVHRNKRYETQILKPRSFVIDASAILQTLHGTFPITTP